MTTLRALFVALSCATLVAQGTGDALIAGVIVDSTSDRPVVRAGIVARPLAAAGLSASAPAYSDGRFSVTLPAGSYRLEVTAPGYETAVVPNLTVAAGDRRTDLRLRLVPLGSVSGVVVGSDSEPIPGALVELIGPLVDGVARSAAHVLKSDAADDRGEYSMTATPAGRYLMKASAPIRRDGLAIQSLFFSGATAVRDATVVEIASGAADGRVDFRLPIVTAVRLRLHVEGEGDEWARFTASSADNPLTRPEPLLLNRSDDGEYVGAIAPGAWRISARSTREGREYRDVQRIVAQGEELDITFAPRPGVSLDGQLVVENAPAAAPGAITISLDPADGLDGPRPVSPVAANGAFHLPNVLAGDWTVSVAGVPSGLSVTSVQLAGRDLGGALVHVTSETRGTLRVVVGPRGAVKRP